MASLWFSPVTRGGVGEMKDIVFVAAVLIFFAVSFWYLRFCDRV
jgi:hypothetical protein